MKREKRNINGGSGRITGNNSWNDPRTDDLALEKQDSDLFKSFGEFMRGRFDLEEVRNDTSLSSIKNEVIEMVSDYHSNRTMRKYDENFIKESLGGSETDKMSAEEIKNIKYEIHRSDVNNVSEEWVKEWHENRKNRYKKDSKTNEISDFITSSLKSETPEPEIVVHETTLNNNKPGKIKRSLLIRYISLSAAAVIGVFLLINTLLPSSDPQKLFTSYYGPFNIISSVTRGGNTNMPDKYSVSVEKYRLGDYKAASAGFTDMLLNDSSSIAPRFFLGLSQLAMANYDQAIIQLNRVSSSPGDYHKEASWYLGLAYLKTGEKGKAAICFNFLAKSSGFYSERSVKILRRLK